MANYLARVAAAGARIGPSARPPLAAPPLMPAPGIAMAGHALTVEPTEAAGAGSTAHGDKGISGVGLETPSPPRPTLSEESMPTADLTPKMAPIPRPMDSDNAPQLTSMLDTPNAPTFIPSEPAASKESAQPLADTTHQAAAQSQREKNVVPRLPADGPVSATTERTEILRVPKSLRPAQESTVGRPIPFEMIPETPQASMPAVDLARVTEPQPVAHESATVSPMPSISPFSPAPGARSLDTPQPQSIPSVMSRSGQVPNIALGQTPTPPSQATLAGSASSDSVQAIVTQVVPGSLSAPLATPRRSRITIGRVEVQIHNQPSPSLAPRPQPMVSALSSRESLNQLRSEHLGLDRFWLRP